jgi:type II secretory ATPase GspE/PulE/Tfp pilus assembly ATPase PilB-like protein
MFPEIFRQDPDMIVIGEIRDQQTAKLAFQASQSHPVFSTLHAEDLNMVMAKMAELSASSVKNQVRLIIHQKLEKAKCFFCQGHGKRSCICFGKGYIGRRAVFKVKIFDKRKKERR